MMLPATQGIDLGLVDPPGAGRSSAHLTLQLPAQGPAPHAERGSVQRKPSGRWFAGALAHNSQALPGGRPQPPTLHRRSSPAAATQQQRRS